jgi:hypothetical protein
MPTERKYTFDVDTKRYLNIVNTYRMASGLSDISNSDAVDIDNFVIGLKDLGVWNDMMIWLYSNKYNSIADRRVIPLKTLNFDYSQQISTFTSTVTGGDTGCIFPLGATMTGPRFVVDLTEISVGFVGTMPTSGSFTGNWLEFNGIRVDGVVDNNLLWLNPRTGFGGEFRFARSFATIADNTLSGFNSWIYTGRFGERTIAYRNGVLAATASTNAATIPYNSATTTLSFTRSGGYNGTASVCFIAKKRFTASQVFSINKLIKETVGKNLNLP